jgi:hypothetical protein
MKTLLVKTHRSAKKLISALMHVVIITCIFTALTCAYIASLIIAKPRELSFLDNLIERSLQSNYAQANVNIENAVISWDKKNFSFNINLYNVDISIPNKLKSFTPHVIIDISRRNLFFTKFIIDKAILTGSEITIIASAKTKSSSKEAITLSPHKMPIFFYNLELYNAKINIANNKFYIRDLTIEKQHAAGLKYISTKTTILHDPLDIEISFKCSIKKSYLSECLGSISNIDNHLIAAFTNNIYLAKSEFNLNSNFRLNWDKQYIANFKISGNAGKIHTGKKSPIMWDKFKSDFSIDFGNNNIAINDLYLSYMDNSINLTGLYDLNSQIASLSLKSDNLSKDYIMTFWPKPFIPKLNNWLTKQTNNLNITHTLLNLEIKVPTKKISTLKLNFDFQEADVSFSKKLGPLTASRGHLALEDNVLTIDVNKGELEDISIDHLTATIDDVLIKKPHNIKIKLNTKTDITNISKYLFKQDLSNFNLKGLSTNYIALDIPIKAGTTLKDIAFDAEININQFGFNYLMKNSKLQISLIKNNHDNNIISGFIDCLKCNGDIPIIEYDKDIIKSEDFTFTIDATPGQTKISNIKNKDLTHLKINADLTFNEHKKLSSLKIFDSYIEESDITYTYEESDPNGQVTILSNNSHIDLDKLAQIFITESDGANNKYKINAKNIYLNNKLLGNDLDITSYTNKLSDIIHYLKFTLPGDEEHIVAKQKITSDNLSTTDIDITNLGLLLTNMGISSKVLNGKVTINTITKNNDTVGKVFVNNIAVTTNKFFQKIQEITSFGATKSEYMIFSQGSGDFAIKNSSVIIDHFSCYGANIGITTSGYINFKEDNYALDGVIIPAATLNTLLGIRHVPIIGNLITGGKDEGLISASYKANGVLGEDPQIKVNPFSTITPGFLRKIFRLKGSRANSNL